MSADDHQRLAELFAAVADLDAPERSAYLAQHAIAPDLCAELEQLLRYHDTDGGPSLDAEQLQTWVRLLTPTLAPGTSVGPYVIGKLLGRGGGGAVYAARQTGALEREVALKVLDRVAEQDLQAPGRFAAERNALASLDHPHIARVYDAQIYDGLAVIALERVAGEPMPAGLAAAVVLPLILQVADALSHAHGRGVIHGDVKPANLLVNSTRTDVKLIDFGLGRPTADPRGDGLRHWSATDRAVGGSPMFMAPEQADPDAIADVRIDVYGLAATLHWVLTGTGPIELPNTSTNAAELFDAVRSAPRPALVRGVPADLSAVICKALSRDRYQSMPAFAADLRHFLRNEPITARRHTQGYLLRKFLRRNAAVVSGAALVFVLLGGGLIGTTAGFFQARAQSDLFRTQLDANEAVNRFLADDLLGSAVPGMEGRDARVLDLLDRARASLSKRFDDQPLVEADLRLTLGETYHRLGQNDQAEPMLEEAFKLIDDAASNDHPQRARALASLGAVAVAQGDYDAAETLMHGALRVRGDTPVHQRARVTAHMFLADIADRRGHWEVAVYEADEAVTLAEALHASTPSPLLLVEALNMRVLVLDDAGRPEAEAFASALAARTAQLLGPDHLYTALTGCNEAATLLDREEFARARPLLESALPVLQREFGPDHPQTLIVVGNLVSALARTGEATRAVQMAEELLSLTEQAYGPRSFEMVTNQHRLAATLYEAGRSEEALPMATRAVDLARESLGADHWLTGQACLTRGLIHAILGDTAAARADLTLGRDILRNTRGADDPRVRSAEQRLRSLDAE